MALRYSFGLHTAADRLDAAIAGVLAAGFRTADIRGEEEATVSTSEMGDAIVKELAQQAAESVTDEEN
jgi:3-isopropylmalate dehydrogenase